ncbi:MAG: hypothetical protein ACI9C1_002637 [Candidatus Aldehydirespiratoraceae bacterium]|jgi:hypothetical protein
MGSRRLSDQALPSADPDDDRRKAPPDSGASNGGSAFVPRFLPVFPWSPQHWVLGPASIVCSAMFFGNVVG